MSKNDGIYLEKIVAQIEKSINPGAIVKHDVDMPILSSKEGHTAQCDVVIWSGDKPREIITICEVQDRPGRPMPPQDVRGFKQKMEEVGAQRVICISRNSFSASNKERAAQSGGSIILMTINDWDLDSLPFNFINIEPSYREFSLIEIGSLDFVFSKDEISHDELDKLNIVPLKTNEKVFSYDKVNLLSLSTLCSGVVENSMSFNFESEAVLDVKKDSFPQLSIYANDKFYKIGISLDFKYKWEFTSIKPYMLSYEQGEHGALAWFLEASHDSKDGLVSMKIPVVKDGEKFIINQIELDMPETCTFHMDVIRGGA